MARLRQQNPQNYISSSYIHTEFEHLIRYLNAAELGNKTISELMAILFDDDGEFRGPIALRLDPTAGLQYRVGIYESETEGWITIVPLSEIRGPAGQNLGLLEGPFFYNRQELPITITPTAVVNYSSMDENVEDIVVYVNGLLLLQSEYSLNFTTGDITFSPTLSNGNKVTVYSIRVSSVSAQRRTDYDIVAPTAVIAFAHTADENILVYRNGLLQVFGGSNDYTNDPASDTVTFFTPLDPGDTATVITVTNSALTNLGGLMLEDAYTNGDGLILYTKLVIADNQIPQAKVSNLATGLAEKAKITISSSTPVSPTSGDLWLDTSLTPNVLKFYDGSTFLLTSPASSLPAFIVADANKYARVNGTGTALEYGALDLSTVVPKTYIGAANGVASLDSAGKLPSAQLPAVFSVSSLPFNSQWDTSIATTANGTYYVTYIWKQTIRVDGIALKLSAGTCDVRISVDGTAVGATYAVTATLSNVNVAVPIQVDGTTTARRIELLVSNQVGAGILEGCLAVATLSV